MFESFNKWSTTLFELTKNDEWMGSRTTKIKETKQLLKMILRNTEFETNLKNAISITKLINIYLMKSQSDNYYLSDVCNDWLCLFEEIEKLNLPDMLHEKVIECARFRWNFIKSTAHIICYQLDPRYKGSKLSREERNEIINTIRNYPIRPEQDIEAELIKELDTFIELEEDIIHSTSRKFWVWNKRDLPLLSTIALRVFALVPSTTSVERSFKTRGNIHSKTRNRLTDDTCTRLLRIKMNYHLLDSQSCKRKFSEINEQNNSDDTTSSTTLSTTNRINQNTTVQNQQSTSSFVIDLSDENISPFDSVDEASDDDNDEIY